MPIDGLAIRLLRLVVAAHGRSRGVAVARVDPADAGLLSPARPARHGLCRGSLRAGEGACGHGRLAMHFADAGGRPEPDGVAAGVIKDAPQSPAGTFHALGEEGALITYHPNQLADPVALVATFAHELAHYRTIKKGAWLINFGCGLKGAWQIKSGRLASEWGDEWKVGSSCASAVRQRRLLSSI